MSKNIGNLCVQCGLDTSFGSGRFVNRIPADNGELTGYLCPDCQAVNCEACVLEASGADMGSIESLIDTVESGALCDHHAPVPA